MKLIAEMQVKLLLRGIQAANAWCDHDAWASTSTSTPVAVRVKRFAVKLLKCRLVVQRESIFGERVISPCAHLLTEQLCDIELQVGHWFVYVHM